MLALYLMLFLSPFIIYTSYTDIKKGKIENFVVSLLILSGLIINFLLFRENLVLWLYNAGFVIFSSISFYAAGITRPADSKLLIGYAILIPPSIYRNPTSFYSFDLIVNIFVPFAVLFVLQTIFKTNNHEKRKSFEMTFNKNYLLSAFLGIMASSAVVNFFSSFFFEINVFLLRLIFIIIIFSLMQKIFGSRQKLVFFILALIGVLVQYPLLMEYSIFMQFIVSFAIILALSFAITLSNFAFSIPLPFSELKSGMIPAVYITFNKKKEIYDKHRIYNRGLIAARKKIDDKFLIHSTPEGLTDKDIEVIKKAYSRGKLDFDRIEIYETLPFAPIISAGVVLTIVFSGSVFGVIQ